MAKADRISVEVSAELVEENRRLRGLVEDYYTVLRDIMREVCPDRMREFGHDPDLSKVWDDARYAIRRRFRHEPGEEEGHGQRD